MSTLVTVVRYNDDHHAFLTPPEERIANLLDGCIDHFPVRRYVPHALTLDGDTMSLDADVMLGDHALRDALKTRDLRLVEVHDDNAAE